MLFILVLCVGRLHNIGSKKSKETCRKPTRKKSKITKGYSMY